VQIKAVIGTALLEDALHFCLGGRCAWLWI